MPYRGGVTASFRRCLKGIKDGQAADGVAYLPVQAKGPEQMLGTAAWLRCLTHDARHGRGCKPLKSGAADLGRFPLFRRGRVRVHADVTDRTPATAAGAHQRRHISVTQVTLP